MALLVGDNLHLDMLGGMDVLLQVHGPVAKGGAALGHGGSIVLLHLGLAGDQADSPAAAAGPGLEHHRIADLRGGLLGLPDAGEDLRAGNHRQARVGHQGLDPILVTEAVHGLHIGADKGDAVLEAPGGEFSVFREEAVARVDGLGPGDQGRAENPLLIQVAVGGIVAADAEALVGQGHMEGLGVSLGIDRHCGNAHLLTTADDAHRHLAPVGNENL